MLNTSLHNPNVRDKPPVERFISMNRGINEGGDLPEELLRVRIGLWWACVGGDERVTASPHFPLCLPFICAFCPPAEPLWQHQKWAFQNPRGWWERSDAHVLQSWQRRLAFKAWYVHQGWLFKIGEWCRRLISEKCKQLQSVTSKMWHSEHNYETIYKTFDMLMIDEAITASLALVTAHANVRNNSLLTTLDINIRCQSVQVQVASTLLILSSAEATLFLLNVCW